MEEEADVDSEDGGDIVESSGTDAVGTFFVFLDLLESDTDPFCELRLAHFEYFSSQTNSFADVEVDGVRTSTFSVFII